MVLLNTTQLKLQLARPSPTLLLAIFIQPVVQNDLSSSQTIFHLLGRTGLAMPQPGLKSAFSTTGQLTISSRQFLAFQISTFQIISASEVEKTVTA